MSKILLVEDNEAIAEGLQTAFELKDMNLIVAESIAQARAHVENVCLSLVLLDVTLPDGNGFDFYNDCVREKNIPTIFLTAKDEEEDIVSGLESGAEDYITKPFSIKELMVRVKKVIARNKRDEIITASGISMDMNKMVVKKGDEEILLSSLELKILALLFENHGKAVSRNTVIDCIWEATGNDVFDHTVTVYMKRIREKLGENIIKTVKGIGYRIDADTDV